MKKYKSYDDIRADLDKGITIYWSSDCYKVFYEDISSSEDTRNRQRLVDAVKDDKMIVCRHTDNWFGGRLHPKEIASCYSKGGNQ